jgi:hypothetical protein
VAANSAEALRRTDDDRRRRSERELRPAIAIGLIAAPGLAADLADGVASDLEAGLAELYPDAEWHVPVVIDGLVRPPATTIELIDAATAATLFLGIASLYLALFASSLAGAGLLITSDTFASAVGSSVNVGDYLRLAWLVSSLATVGGALGAGLESDVAIREAAFAYRSPPEE